MADIVKIICTNHYGNEIRRIEAGVRPDQTYYFENEYTFIPNEFKLAPAYFPKLFFTAIIGCLRDLVRAHADDPEVKYRHWFFDVFYRGGEHRFYQFTEEEVQASAPSIKKYFYYNDFLDDVHDSREDPADKKFLQTSTSLITLQNVRGQVARRFVLLDEFFENRTSTYGKADFNSANYTLSYAKDGGLRFSLKDDPENVKDTLIVKIHADGCIEADGAIPYVRLLKDKGVRVISPKTDTGKDVMPFMTAVDYVRYSDPRYLSTASDQEFSFENEDEYRLFMKNHQGLGKVTWLKDDTYAGLYRQAFSHVENNRFSEALPLLQECLKLNPVAIAARFEMANCLIGMRDYEEAKKCLVVLSQFLTDSEDKAKLYRLFGYIFTVEKHYPPAYVCYRQSLEVTSKYNMNEYTIKQMIDVEKKERIEQQQQKPIRGYDVQWWSDVEGALKYYRIPVLKRF